MKRRKIEFPDELISGYLDNELSDEERKQVEQLLSSSTKHQRVLEELRALCEGLKTLPRHELGTDFHQRIVDKISAGSNLSSTADDNEATQDVVTHDSGQIANNSRSLMRRIWPIVAIAAGLLVILMATQPRQELAKRMEVEQLSESATSDLESLAKTQAVDQVLSVESLVSDESEGLRELRLRQLEEQKLGERVAEFSDSEERGLEIRPSAREFSRSRRQAPPAIPGSAPAEKNRAAANGPGFGANLPTSDADATAVDDVEFDDEAKDKADVADRLDRAKLTAADELRVLGREGSGKIQVTGFTPEVTALLARDLQQIGADFVMQLKSPVLPIAQREESLVRFRAQSDAQSDLRDSKEKASLQIQMAAYDVSTVRFNELRQNWQGKKNVNLVPAATILAATSDPQVRDYYQENAAESRLIRSRFGKNNELMTKATSDFLNDADSITQQDLEKPELRFFAIGIDEPTAANPEGANIVDGFAEPNQLKAKTKDTVRILFFIDQASIQK